MAWASHSLIGHIVVFQVVISLPLIVRHLAQDYSEGVSLSAGRVAFVALAWVAAGLVIAVAGWYTITLPLIKARDKKKG